MCRPSRPFVCPQIATNIPTAGSNNNSVVSSPWLSIAARPTANSMGPRTMSRRLGALQCGISISNPSDLEAGEVDTAGSQSNTQRPKDRDAQAESCVWLLRPPALPFKAPLGV